MPAAPSSPRSSTRPGSHRSERNRPVPLSLVAGIGAMSGVLNAANEVPSKKKTLKHYGSMRSLLHAHASPSPSHRIELRNPGLNLRLSNLDPCANFPFKSQLRLIIPLWVGEFPPANFQCKPVPAES